MKRTFLILIVGVLFASCGVTKKITYNTTDIQNQSASIPIDLDVRILEDVRAQNAENDILFTSKQQTRMNDETMCINAEKSYKKDSVSRQITQMIVNHFNRQGTFRKTMLGNTNSDYYLTGKLSSFYGEQKFSTAALVGSQFGLLGAIATSGVKTPGTIKIEIKNLKLYKNDGTLVKDLGDFSRTYEDKFPADAYCWCIYDNINLKLKEFNTELAEKMILELANVEL